MGQIQETTSLNTQLMFIINSEINLQKVFKSCI